MRGGNFREHLPTNYVAVLQLAELFDKGMQRYTNEKPMQFVEAFDTIQQVVDREHFLPAFSDSEHRFDRTACCVFDFTALHYHLR
jgi:hypothetical protein